MHRITRVLLIALAVTLGGVSIALASSKAITPAPAPATASVMFAADPFLNGADIQTRVPMAPYCPCDVYANCAYKPLGYDCASPSGCCSCRGVNPALRQCVGIAP